MKNVPKNKTQVGNGAVEEKRQPIACFRAGRSGGQGPAGRPNLSGAQRSSGVLLPDNGERGWLQEVPCGSAVSLRLGNQEAAGKEPRSIFKNDKRRRVMKAVALGPGRSSRGCGEGTAVWELQGHSVLPPGLTGGGGGGSGGGSGGETTCALSVRPSALALRGILVESAAA